MRNLIIILLATVALCGQTRIDINSQTRGTLAEDRVAAALPNRTLSLPIIGAYTVGTLPAAGTAGRIAVVTDASTAGSCTVGGGSALSLCRDSGAAWVPVGDGGTGGSGNVQIQNAGTNVGSPRGTLDFLSDANGIDWTITDTGSKVTIQAVLDTAKVLLDGVGNPEITPQIKSYTVATLPTVAAGTIVRVTDTSTDCSTGGGSTVRYCEYNGSAWATFGGAGGGLANVVEDTTPQLGGNLDLNTYTVGAASAADLTKLAAVTATSTEVNHLTGVTSNVQTQLNGKAATSHTHAAADITSGTLAASLLPVPTTTTLGGVKRNTGSAGQYVTGVSATGDLEYDTPAGGGIGGTLGSADNAVPKADGTGGSTLQASSLNIPDNHNWTLNDVPQPRVVWSAVDTTGTMAFNATLLSFSVPAGLLAVGDMFKILLTVEKEDTDLSGTLSNTGYNAAVNGGGTLFTQSAGLVVQGGFGAEGTCWVTTSGWLCNHHRANNLTLYANGADVLTGAWTLNINLTNGDTTDRAFVRRVVMVVYK